MIQQRYGTLGGLTVPVNVYESYEEGDKVVPNGLLKQANDNLVYRGVLNDVRELVCDIVAEATGVARKMFDKAGKETTVEKDATEDEKSSTYLKRVCVENGWLTEDGVIDLTRFQSTLDEKAKTADEGGPYAADVSQRERKPRKARTIPAEVALKVAKIYDGDKRDAFIGAVREKLNAQLNVTGDREADLKAFGLAAMDFNNAVKRELAEEAKKKTEAALFGS